MNLVSLQGGSTYYLQFLGILSKKAMVKMFLFVTEMRGDKSRRYNIFRQN